IGTLDAANLQIAAETLATNMSTKLSTILPCTPASASAEAGCASMFITTFGAKVYRRPLTTAETTTLNTLYQTGRTTRALDVNVLASRPKDPMLYAMWNQDLAAAMETEFRSFGTTAVLGTGLFADLMTGNKSSVNQALATVYGVSGVTGTTPKAVTFDASQRAGILTLAGFLTVTGASDGSSPVRRGHAIYTRLLCGTVPDPPANVPPAQPPTPGLTTRQRFEAHDMAACTGTCHSTMDPIGFGFEHYDGIGQWRTTDQNL